MKSKVKGTKKAKRMERFVVINPDAAGVDIGDTEICVAISPEKCEENVRTYGTFTSDLDQIVAFLKENSIHHVAMEATGVSWIQLYLLLEREGFQMTLANARYIKDCRNIFACRSSSNSFRLSALPSKDSDPR